MYDQTGSLADSEELAGEQFDALREYFRTLYKQVGLLPTAPNATHAERGVEAPERTFVAAGGDAVEGAR